MDLAFDARARLGSYSSFTRTLELLETSAERAGLTFEEWQSGPCTAPVLWSPQLEPPPVQNLRLVLTLHDVNPLQDDGRPWFQRLRREFFFRRKVQRALARSWRLVTDSQDSAERIRQAFPQIGDRIHVVPLFADPMFQPGEVDPAFLAASDLKPGYVLFLGAMRRHKNWDRLLRAYARLPLDLRQAHPLIFAGSRRRARRSFPQLVAELALQNHVRHLGSVAGKDLPKLYRGAALFVFPSSLEGFGLPPLEAMACGTPVVSSPCTSLPEVLGEAPAYADPEDLEAFAETMQQILQSPPLQQKLKSAGLLQAQRYHPGRTGESMKQLLQTEMAS
ncbi:MAG: glycosyltransferase family 1 protein [Planctomycetota bacterium]|nr:MAG: glycosyltransferase family 1 protein [Planctomycetota bacterium]